MQGDVGDAVTGIDISEKTFVGGHGHLSHSPKRRRRLGHQARRRDAVVSGECHLSYSLRGPTWERAGPQAGPCRAAGGPARVT